MTAIERIDAEIVTLENRIAGLRYARGIVEPEVNGSPSFATRSPILPLPEPAAKKSPPPVAPSRPEGAGNRYDEQKMERRKRIVALIVKNGPQSMTDIEKSVECSTPTAQSSLAHPWFVKVDPNNRLSPWTLTESGRKSAESN